jgi:predicted TIM-barrel fold metal-dependent hydrolase
MAAELIIDAHVHIFPDLLERLPAFARPLTPAIEELRRRARTVLRPFASSLHRAQTALRHLPEPARRRMDALGAVLPAASLLVESTAADLAAAMAESGVAHAVVIAHPPLVPNELVLDACAENPALVPAVNIAPGTPKPGQRLRKYVERGARILKIHPAADGEGVDSPRYKALLKTADELGLPVILHTGCIHSHLLYKSPEEGRVERFSRWFEEYRQAKFILAHMNFHEPYVALDLAEEHPNLMVDTSWQPTEMIGEAVRRLGPGKVLFGSDWPLVGQNMAVGIARVRDCVDTGTLGPDEAAQVLGLNAARLFGVDENRVSDAPAS